jgi:hypothetical protein
MGDTLSPFVFANARAARGPEHDSGETSPHRVAVADSVGVP